MSILSLTNVISLKRGNDASNQLKQIPLSLSPLSLLSLFRSLSRKYKLNKTWLNVSEDDVEEEEEEEELQRAFSRQSEGKVTFP